MLSTAAQTRDRVLRALTQREFEACRALVAGYFVVALLLSGVLLQSSTRRGVGELLLWLPAYLGVAALSLRQPRDSVLAAGAVAFVLGFLRTHRHGPDLDLGVSLILLSVGLYGLRHVVRHERRVALDLAALWLLLIAALSLVSVGFALVRIRSFVMAPGFSYHTYPFSGFRMSSDEAVIRAIIGASSTFAWFGLYAYARAEEVKRATLNRVVFLVLLVNSAVLLVQGHVDTGFLQPAGQPPSDPRENGVTSYSYALGDTMLGLFLLLPAWGCWKGMGGARTVAALGMLAHGISASGSRTALLTVVIAAFLWGAIRVGRLVREGRASAAALLLAMLGAAAGLMAVGYRLAPADVATPLGRLKFHVAREGFAGHLMSTRLNSYPLMLRVLGEYPLSGVGAGLFSAEVGKQRSLLMPEARDLDPFILTSYAPNQFLNSALELGLLALLGLVVVFVSAGLGALWRGGPGRADRGASLLALFLALQVGPAFYNSEALVFLWLVVGGAAGRWAATTAGRPRLRGRRVCAVLLGGGVALALVGQVLARPSLALDAQWRRLRWRMTSGMQPPEAGGQWTSSESTFVVDTGAPELLLRWHAGHSGAPTYRAEVTFFVDGVQVEKSPAISGQLRQSRLPLPPVPGFKRISVRVSPPFVPAEWIGGDDRRQLGVFLSAAAAAPRAGGAGGPVPADPEPR